MKHFYSFVIALLLLPLLAVAQDSPEDQYITIYDMIQQADLLNDAANIREALPKYKEAQDALKKFQSAYPTWNTKIVKFRLNYLASKVGPLEVGTEPAPVAEPTVTAKPAVTLSPETGSQIQSLREQLRQAQLEKADLEKQLRQISEAKSSASTASQALAEAQGRIASLQQENDRLKTDIKQQLPVSSQNEVALMERASRALAEAKAKLVEQTRLATVLTQQNETLQKRLEAVTADPSGSSQIASLQQELRRAEADRIALQNQLKEAQTRTAGSADQISRAEEKIKNLQKENSLLRASLEQRPPQTIQTADSFAAEQNKQAIADFNKKLQEQSTQIADLTREKEALQKRLDAAVNTDALTKDLADARQALKKLQRRHDIQTEAATVLIVEYKMKVRKQAKAAEAMTRQLEEYKRQLASGENSELIAKLRDENDSLKRQIADLQARSDTAAGKSGESGDDLIAVQSRVAGLQSQLDVLMAKPIPYTEDELALMKAGTNALAVADTSKNAMRGLPPGAADLVTEAQRLFAAHKLKDAEAKYQQVLKLSPNNVFTLANLATIQIERDNFTDAEKNLRKAMKLEPKDAFTLGVWGNLLFRLAKYDDAFEVLSRAAQIDPNSAEIQNILGITLSHKGQRGAAETALRKALQLDPNYGNAHNNLAVIYITQDPPLTELAKWHYQKALSLGIGRNADLERLLDSGSSPEKK